MKRFMVTIIILAFTVLLFGQSPHKNLRNGDMLYGFGRFTEAETEYRKADSNKASLKSSYNMANALMQQERYEEAIKKYQDAMSKAFNDTQKAAIQHNLGNALYKKQQFKESVDAFKKALKYIPNDAETKENLALARRELKKQEQQKQKDNQNKDKNKEQDDQKNKDQDQQNDKNEQNQQNQQKDQQEQQNKDQQNKSQASTQNEKEMSRQDAQKLLEIMDNEEKKVQQKLRRIDGKSGKPKKDW